jgi:V8-like Glu-specific endopeptidase
MASGPGCRALGDLLNRWTLATAALVVTAAALGATASVLAGAASGAPTLTATSGRPRTVGALFDLTRSGGLGSHFCTASVVDSPAGNLVLTAAHCLTSQSAGGVVFVPDYHDGRAPYGTWTVTRVIVDQDWNSSANPDDDFAFLVVSQAGAELTIQQITGGEIVGIDTPPGRAVTAAGYPDGQGAMISCDNTVVAFSPTQFEFDCGGFTDGTSGSPLLAVSTSGGPATVIGVIGGYQRGGDSASVSYAARFSTRMKDLYQTALADAGP